MSIPGVLEARQTWKAVWSWEGNNVDGPIAADNGAILFANNDAGNVMQFDPATGFAKIAYANINTAGAVSRSKAGTLFVAGRGLGGGHHIQKMKHALDAIEPIFERCRLRSGKHLSHYGAIRHRGALVQKDINNSRIIVSEFLKHDYTSFRPGRHEPTKLLPKVSYEYD